MSIIKNFFQRNLKRLQLRSQVYVLARQAQLRRNLLLHSYNASTWEMNGTNVTLRKMDSNYKAENYPSDIVFNGIHEESKGVVELILGYGKALGYTRMRLNAKWDTYGGTTRTYEFLMYSTEKNVEEKHVKGVIIDVDKIEQDEKKMKAWMKSINQCDINMSYLCSISHDIRTPLNAVTGFSQIISNSDIELSKADKEEYTMRIKENATMMLSMIDSVTLSKHTGQEELTLKQRPMSASTFIHNCYSDHLVIKPSHLKLLENLPSADCMVEMDPIVTRMVMNNFLSNAFKFTDIGSVEIGWRPTDDGTRAVFFCKDTGNGVSEENKDHIFERYYKGSESDIGTGLGLNISKEIIEKQGGNIGFDSMLKKGSTFWFTLKIKE